MVLAWTEAAGPSAQSTPGRRLLQVGWIPPPASIIKVNVDGTSKGNPGRAAARCVLHDQDDGWIVSGAQNLGLCTSLQVELWATMLGLQVAWDHGFRKIDGFNTGVQNAHKPRSISFGPRCVSSQMHLSIEEGIRR